MRDALHIQEQLDRELQREHQRNNQAKPKYDFEAYVRQREGLAHRLAKEPPQAASSRVDRLVAVSSMMA